MPDSTRMNILFMASEADPFVKVGGLGDVAGSLPRAIGGVNESPQSVSTNPDIRLVIPFHPSINVGPGSPRLEAEFPITFDGGEITVKAFSLEAGGLTIYLLAGAPIDNESAVYSSDLEADGFKYVFFSQAALELVKTLKWKPDILHANDWHTASAVYSLSLRRSTDQFFGKTTTLLTVHNLPFLGSMTSQALDAFYLPPAIHSDLPPWAQHMALPLGLLAADEIVAVSPGYSHEILTEEFGSGLDQFLQAHRDKITGILNGLDTVRWDPSTDDALAANYSINNLEQRSENKSALNRELGFETKLDIPLLAMVTRMDPQKGVDLAVDAIRRLLKTATRNGAHLHAVFLGTGDPSLEDAVRNLEQGFPNQVRARITYDEKLSRRIYAGADMLLMPSRYEPCGLSQMIAMRYGCVPVARATGGLSDTIHDPAKSDEATGFLFTKPLAGELVKAIRRALKVYSHQPKDWHQIMINGMVQDFSWDRSAFEYIALYKHLLRI